MKVLPEGIDILSPEAVADPQGYFSRVRDASPVAFDQQRGAWLITSYEHMSTVLKSPDVTSDRISGFIKKKLSSNDVDPLIRQVFEILQDWLVFNDPPRHTRLRKLVHKAFTAKAVEALRGQIDELADRLLDELPTNGPVDIKQGFTDPLAAIVIAQLLGVPLEDRARFKAWSEDVSLLVSAGLDRPDRYVRAAASMDELAHYCTDLLRKYKEHPEDNLMSRLVLAQEEDEALSDAEVVATCTLVLFAGHETTANFMANALVALIRHPDQLEALRSGQVEVRTAVEELLRFDGPGKAMMRNVRDDFELGGQQLRRGDKVFLVIASANRDPQIFEEPNRLKLDRTPNPHIAFGYGIHSCMGSPLARLEASIAIPKVLSRYSQMRLDDQAIEYFPVFLARGMESLTIHVG